MRLFIQPSWRDAASDHSEWSGESPDDRKRRSHMIGDKANIGAYSDESLGLSSTKAKPKRSIRERILSQEVRLSNIEGKLKDLEAEKHTIPYEDYVQLKAILNKDYARAYELLERRLDSVNKIVNVNVKQKLNVSEAVSRQILSENKRSALKAKHPKLKTINVKHDRKSLSKVADWINRNDWAYLLICSIIVLTAAKIIF